MITQALQAEEAELIPNEPIAPDEHIAPAPRISVQAFCDTVETASAVQAAGDDRRLVKAHLKLQMGGVTAAVEAYRTSPTPNVVLLETETRGHDILAGLDQLAEVCDAGTRVVVVGRINDVVLYRELVRRGVSEYLIAPVSTIDVVRAICGLYAPAADAKPLGRVIAVVGAKGGVGASTIAHNLAWAIAGDLKLDAVVTDLDLAFGTAGLDYNQDPRRVLRTRFSRPSVSTPISLTGCCRNAPIISACWQRPRRWTASMTLPRNLLRPYSIRCAPPFPVSCSTCHTSGPDGLAAR